MVVFNHRDAKQSALVNDAIVAKMWKHMREAWVESGHVVTRTQTERTLQPHLVSLC